MLISLFLLIVSSSAKPLLFPNGIGQIELAEVKTGDTVVITTGPVWVMDKKAHDLSAAGIKKQKLLDSLILLHQSAVDSILPMYRNLMKHYEKIDSLQNFFIDSVNVINTRTDSLLTRSINNTRKAVKQSYFVSAILGGIAGFTIPGDQKYWVKGVSGLGGAAIGMFINHIIFR